MMINSANNLAQTQFHAQRVLCTCIVYWRPLPMTTYNGVVRQWPSSSHSQLKYHSMDVTCIILYGIKAHNYIVVDWRWVLLSVIEHSFNDLWNRNILYIPRSFISCKCTVNWYKTEIIEYLGPKHSLSQIIKTMFNNAQQYSPPVYNIIIISNEAFHASTYVTVLVHISTILQKYPHKINKAKHTCPEQWCVALLNNHKKKLIS